MNLEIEKDSSYLSKGVYFNALQSAYTSISKGRKYKIPNQYSPGTLIFELQLKSVKKARKAKNKNKELKSIENCYDSTIIKQTKKFGSQARELLESTSQNYYSKDDDISIKAIDYSINNYDFHIDFGKEDLIKTKQHQLAIIQALDKAKVSQDSYQQIAAVNPTISREGAISSERILLNKQMEANIKIIQVNLDCLEVEEDFANTNTDSEIEEEIIDVNDIDIVEIDGIGAQCSIKDLLNYNILYLEQSNILKCDDPVVHLRISGNGRNVGCKIKHIMVTIMILNDIEHHYKSDFHYTTVLYPGVEKYKTLKFMLNSLLNDLRFLKRNGLQIGTICWNFEFYFSADLKFFSICLGLNATNSTYFCPWYNINKNQHENTQANWRITKTIDQLKSN
ncbi:3423_t:CDS:2 [Gigaspora margarita]|uniref:3423_t:CDS:1 n=1 Tax=Gigaspora margarita TaxID=4874 RepID=A0ABM8W4D2_GIGMA|nr:3423_t:CDS:2 [Gigaspora margarita]